MDIDKLLSERLEFELVVCDVLSGFLELQHDDVVCVRVALMYQDVWEHSGCTNLAIQRIARGGLESFGVTEMAVVLAAHGKRRPNSLRKRHVVGEPVRARTLRNAKIK